jgi:hypothetical protein
MLWKPVHLFTFKRKFDFLGQRKPALILSTLINVISLLGVAFVGLNFGIDFKGGVAIQARAKQGVAQLDELRDDRRLGVGGPLQGLRPGTALIRIQRRTAARKRGRAQGDAEARRPGWQVKPGRSAPATLSSPPQRSTRGLARCVSRAALRPGAPAAAARSTPPDRHVARAAGRMVPAGRHQAGRGCDRRQVRTTGSVGPRSAKS